MPKIQGETKLTNDQIDTLIKQYQEQIRTVTAAAENLPYRPAPIETGIAVNLVA